MTSPVTDSFDLDLVGGQRMLLRLSDEIFSAGEAALVLAKQGVGERAQRKADDSPVTEADRMIETRLRAFVAQHLPKAGFVGEEEGEVGGDRDLRFIVDPIDGTRAFMRGLDGWSILVGLEHLKEPVLGLAYLPAREEFYCAIKGAGSTANGKPLHVSTTGKLHDALLVHGSLSQFTEDHYSDLLLALAKSTFTQRGFGDFLGYRAIAMGQADVLVDPALKPWDMCAPAVIVREAGGTFTSLSGQATIYGGGALASNGLLHSALVDVCKPYINARRT